MLRDSVCNCVNPRVRREIAGPEHVPSCPMYRKPMYRKPGSYDGPTYRCVLLSEHEHRTLINLCELNANVDNAVVRKKLQLSLNRLRERQGR